jgi:prepilin-type N-terminal cleavage/methylation domain-containing protein
MRNKKGFSLMEVLMVTVFIGIMSAVAITSLTASRTKRQVEGTAREASAAIREAQNGGLTGKKTDATHLPCNYYFIWNSTTSYSITYQYHTGSSSNCAAGPYNPTNQTLATYTTKDNVSVGSFTTIAFNVPFASMSGPVFPLTIIISKGSVNYAVCVSSSGNIWENQNGTCL